MDRLGVVLGRRVDGVQNQRGLSRVVELVLSSGRDDYEVTSLDLRRLASDHSLPDS